MKTKPPLRYLVLLVLALTLAEPALVQAAPPAEFPISCSPAPCVLPPTQASEGGAEVADAPIVSNPLNPAQLLLGSSDSNCQYGLGFFFSANAGSTWTRTCLTQSIGLNTPNGEPIVGYDHKGTAYAAAVYMHSGYRRGLVGIQSSTDGVNWSNPVTALQEGMFPSNPWLAVDTNVGSPYVNNLYISAVVGTNTGERLYVSHSSDGGATWKAIAAVPAQSPPDYDNYTNLTVDRNGTVYLTWMYCNVGPSACANGKGYMMLSRSTDGGNTWSTPAVMTTVELLLNPIPNTNVYASNIPAIASDNSKGPYSGYLYAVMYSWTGTFMRVQVIHSSDGGTTWSKPVPVAPLTANHDQFFPWLSVSPTGLVGVSWLDRRNDPANINYQAFAAISSNGGQSFQPNVQLTTAFSNPNVNGYIDNAWMGDYTGNTWAGPNYFIAAWMDSSNGVDMQDVIGGIRLH